MRTFALIPFKDLNNPKSRLSAFLPKALRLKLSLRMLNGVVERLSACPLIEEIAVISREFAVRREIQRDRIRVLMEDSPGLNSALVQGTRWCKRHGASHVLILPSDIPFLRTVDVENVIDLGKRSPSVVICPSTDLGTNGLLRSPPDCIPPRFGLHSFQKHLQAAMIRGIWFTVYWSTEIILDIDSPQDFEKLLGFPGYSSLKRYLTAVPGSGASNRK